MKTADALNNIANHLATAGIEDARREARILLRAALNTDAAGLLNIPDIDEAQFAPLLARRMAREPMAYITGQREFFGLIFATSPATLIPRPDSETLIETAIAAFTNRSAPKTILDLGTGTGCLLLAALQQFPSAVGIGVDLSPAAAALAARNAQSLGLAPRAAFLAGNWATALNAKFNLILANPPYIPTTEIPALMPEVAHYEPRAALDGGADGLAAYRTILRHLPGLLAKHGTAILECGAGQAETLQNLARQAGFSSTTAPDLAGHTRILILTNAAQK